LPTTGEKLKFGDLTFGGSTLTFGGSIIEKSSLTSGILGNSISFILGISLFVIEGDLTVATKGLIVSYVFKSYFLITGTGSFNYLGDTGLIYKLSSGLSFSGDLMYLTLVNGSLSYSIVF
jgi:hypothetical protein